jgi:hypothetical protein
VREFPHPGVFPPGLVFGRGLVSGSSPDTRYSVPEVVGPAELCAVRDLLGRGEGWLERPGGHAHCLNSAAPSNA